MPKFNIPDIKLQIDIPGLNLTKGSAIKCTEQNGKKICNMPWIGEYIAGIYKYAIGIVGILAAVVLMIGGVMWIVAGGSATMIGEAKSWIGASLTGLVIALCSYIILYQVNPALVGFNGLNIQIVDQTPVPADLKAFAEKCKPTESGECSVSKMAIFGDKAREASAICMAESSGVANAKNTLTKCDNGNYYAVWGLFQFNLSANYLMDENNNRLNCPDAFGNRAWVNSSPTCTVINVDLYNQCVAAASNPAVSISNAKRLAGGSGWGPWEANSKWCNF
ncbi:MAG: pilin [Patescibacteria group bacterium]